MDLCKDCKKRKFTRELKQCKKCGVTSDKDKSVLVYCSKCAKKLGVCRGCGRK